MASDNFNRADSGTLGANWGSQLASVFGVASNQAAPQNGANVHTDYYVGTFSADQYSEATASGMSSGSVYVGVVVRASTSANTSYAFITDGASGAGHTFIRRTVAGTETDILNIATTVSNGAVIRLEIADTELTAKVGGVTVGTVTDATIASGNPGVWAYGGAGRLDDWGGDDLSGNVIHDKTTTDTVTLTDGSITSVLRTSIQSDTITIFDNEGVSRFHDTTIEDFIEQVTDEAMLTVLRTRVTDDGLTLLDLLSSVLSGSGTLYDFTLSDALSVSDGSLASVFRQRISEDQLGLSDGTLASVLRDRLTEDQMELVEHLFKSLEKLRDANVQVLDEGIASILRDATNSQDVKIDFGSGPSGIVFGGYN